MISEKEIYKAIDGLESCSNPTYETVKKLADFYIVKNELFGYPEQASQSSHVEEKVIGEYGDSEFCNEICGMDSVRVFTVMDELMATLQIVNPRLYNAVMRKLKEQ